MSKKYNQTSYHGKNGVFLKLSAETLDAVPKLKRVIKRVLKFEKTSCKNMA